MKKILPALTLAAFAAVSVSACGSSSSGGTPSTNPTANPTAAKAAITHTYETFFSSPVPQAKTLLQDGNLLSKAFKVATKLKGNVQESAKVKSVTLTGSNTADVQYLLLGNGKPVLPGGGTSTGHAVYQNGHWLVAKSTFCGLVGLADPHLPNC